MAPALSVLVVDDDPDIRDLLAEALDGWGHQVATAATAREALELLGRRIFDVAVVDIHLPEMDGIELLRQMKQRDEGLTVVMVTGAPTVASAVSALKLGAYDYLTKPTNLLELEHLIGHLAERRYLRGEVASLRSRLGEQLKAGELVGSSPAMAELKALVTRVAGSDSPVLIEGESGTGKELVAAALHWLSPRAAAPLIPVNCGAVPAELIESEFFGHVRGAFSGAVADTLGHFRSADGGTLFLDEVAELPASLQVKLLRVLQDKEVRPVGGVRSHAVDVRVVAATNRDLDAAVKDGTLRADLFYRLNVVRIAMPPLRDRRADIPALAAYFVRRFNHRFGRDVRGLAPDALEVLMTYEFPGNVRELENLVERAFALGARDEIRAGDLPALRPRLSARLPPEAGEVGGPLVPPGADRDPQSIVDRGEPLPTLADAERRLIVRALEMCGRDRNRAARALGLSPRTLYRRLKEYGIR